MSTSVLIAALTMNGCLQPKRMPLTTNATIPEACITDRKFLEGTSCITEPDGKHAVCEGKTRITFACIHYRPKP
jgi:hypothetical protein